MATRAAIAEMEANARKRIDAASATLAKRHGIDAPVVPFERKPELVMTRHLEAQAAFLEALAGDSSDDLADVQLGAEITTDGEPVVVTEAIDDEPAPDPKAKSRK